MGLKTHGQETHVSSIKYWKFFQTWIFRLMLCEEKRHHCWKKTSKYGLPYTDLGFDGAIVLSQRRGSVRSQAYADHISWTGQLRTDYSLSSFFLPSLFSSFSLIIITRGTKMVKVVHLLAIIGEIDSCTSIYSPELWDMPYWLRRKWSYATQPCFQYMVQ